MGGVSRFGKRSRCCLTDFKHKQVFPLRGDGLQNVLHNEKYLNYKTVKPIISLIPFSSLFTCVFFCPIVDKINLKIT